jgi:hypothetical protein
MIVYVIGPVEGPYKIGYTNNLKQRLSAIQTSHPHDVFAQAIRHVSTAAEAKSIESAAHETLKGVRLRGEWFACHVDDAAIAVGAQERYDPQSKQTDKLANARFLYDYLLRGYQEASADNLAYFARCAGADSTDPHDIANARVMTVHGVSFPAPV